VVVPELAGFEIGELLKAIAADVEPHAGGKDVSLKIVRSSCRVRSDPRLLETIIQNLAFNAIRYTPKGGRVLIGCRRRGSNLRIEVWDTGVGIPQEQLEAIFEEFVQLDNPERSRDKGLGLGLAIVSRLSSLLGHATDVRSVPGRGSVFCVTVPLAPPAGEHAAAAGGAASDARSGCDARLLLIDDDEAIVQASSMLLRLEGFQVETAAGIEEARALIEDEGLRPDLVVCDYRLPAGQKGTEVVHRVRELLGWPVPAIILTGDTSNTLLRGIREMGLDVLYKPVAGDDFVAAIRRTLARAD
jgi:two-component system CheB/CheR fusion protein